MQRSNTTEEKGGNVMRQYAKINRLNYCKTFVGVNYEAYEPSYYPHITRKQTGYR